jgi:hypothetical protein
MSNKLNNQIVASLKTYDDLVDKLNRDSSDMYDSLDLENREDDVSQDQYQALLVHHILITTSNLASNLTDHLYYLIKKIEAHEKIDTNEVINELLSIVKQIDNYTFEQYPPSHFQDVEEFVKEMHLLKQQQREAE